MDLEKYKPLRAYEVPRNHIELEELIGEGAAGEVGKATVARI